MIGIESKGSFAKTAKFLGMINNHNLFDDLNRYGADGVDALRTATPLSTGETASSWDYKIVRRKGRWHVEWFNTHVNDGVNIAVVLQYGHATADGGYVPGIDYINPAIHPIFEALSENVWKKVTNA